MRAGLFSGPRDLPGIHCPLIAMNLWYGCVPMRRNIVHPGASELTYEIRGITELAYEIQRLSGQPCSGRTSVIRSEGRVVPDWIKDIVADCVRDNSSFGYCPTRESKTPVSSWPLASTHAGA
jgi:hypothetical protein